MRLFRRFLQKHANKKYDRDSFEARKQMEEQARKEMASRLKALEIRFQIETRGHGDNFT